MWFLKRTSLPAIKAAGSKPHSGIRTIVSSGNFREANMADALYDVNRHRRGAGRIERSFVRVARKVEDTRA